MRSVITTSDGRLTQSAAVGLSSVFGFQSGSVGQRRYVIAIVLHVTTVTDVSCMNEA